MTKRLYEVTLYYSACKLVLAGNADEARKIAVQHVENDDIDYCVNPASDTGSYWDAKDVTDDPDFGPEDACNYED